MPSLELFLPNDLGLGLLFITTIDNGNHCLCEIDEGEACSRVAGEGCWGAGIAVVADALNERHLVGITLDGAPYDGEAEFEPATGGPNRTDVALLPIPENTTGRSRTFCVTLALAEYPDVTLVLTVRQDA